MASNRKKAIDLSGLPKKKRKLIENPRTLAPELTGVACDNIEEPLPTYIEAPCESVVKNNNGSYIVLGRDRPASLVSGYGGKGDTQCASIDLVAGRQGPSLQCCQGRLRFTKTKRGTIAAQALGG